MEFQARIQKKKENQEVPRENNENHENRVISLDNHENHENLKIQC